MSLNNATINAFAVNSGAGAVIAIGSGALITIEQDVQLRLSSTVPESIISIEQSVQTTAAGALITLEQRVRTVSATDHLSRTGWDLTLFIGGAPIPSNQIHGKVELTRTENDASLLNITLRPPIGAQDLDSYHGKSVVLDAQVASGTHRMFTGVVDIPVVDLILETITLRCTDKRRELVNAQLGSVKNNIGVYSSYIFQTPEDISDEVDQRLTTTPVSVDFDGAGVYTINSWTPKATPDITLSDADVYRTKPRVEYASRARITNKVNINMQYRYQRFHHHTRTFSWTHPAASNICLQLTQGYSLTPRSMVQAAAESTGWPLVSSVNFTDVHPGGWYRCSGQTIGWAPVTFRGKNVAKTNLDGSTSTDPNGNTVYETQLTGATDVSGALCLGALWQASTQWSQTITEEYTLSVNAPQSQTQYGPITRDLSYAVEQDTSADEWEENAFARSSDLGINYNLDQDLNRDEFSTAVNVALYQARNYILESHRDTRVTVNTSLRPDIELKHTVQVSTDEVSAKGKVYKMKHLINVGTGEAVTTTTIVLSRIQGSQADDAFATPTVPIDTPQYPTTSVRLGNHFGIEPRPDMTGYVGNKTIVTSDNRYKTQYQESFRADTPAIGDELRQSKILEATAAYNISIPNDSLTITFDGKS